MDIGFGGGFDSGFGGGFGSGIGSTFDFMFTVVPILMLIIFVVMIGTIVWRVTQKKKNDNLPQLTVSAKVVAKRTDVSHYRNMDNADVLHGSSYSRYYVTFEVESGDRMELYTPGNEFGLLVEGDSGSLTFRGKDFISFKRI